MENDAVELVEREEPVPADGVVGRGDPFERALELAREDDVDDVLRRQRAAGGDRVDDRDRALERRRARFRPPRRSRARARPSTSRPNRRRRRAAARRRARACRGGRAGSRRPSAAAPRRGSGLRADHGAFAATPDEPSPPAPRSLSVSSSTSQQPHGRRLDEDELRHPHPGLDDERLPRVGVEQDHLDLASIARVDQPRRVDNGDPMPGGKARARQHEAGPALRYRNCQSRAGDPPLPWPELDALARRQVEPRVAVIGLRGRTASSRSRAT